MKTKCHIREDGSVLLVTILTITIMSLVCATSLYISTQNISSGMQTSGWQQSLTAAESGVDAAVRALNQSATSGANAWTNWRTVSSTLPTSGAGYAYEPASGTGSAASGLPSSSQYNYLPSSNLTISFGNSEGATSVKAWTTIDTAGNTNLVSSGQQWYRIRSTGQTVYPSGSTLLKRVSNNRLDNDLRNTIAMNYNRKGGSTLGPSRTIEVIMQPIPQGGSAKGITLANWLQMTGGGTADSFSSPNGQWSSAYRDTSYPLLVEEGATGGKAKFANNGQMYVYGGVNYSGSPPTNTNNTTVAGQISTPASVNLPAPADPTAISGQSGHYGWSYQDPWNGVTSSYTFNSSTSYTGGGGLPKDSSNNNVTSITANGTASAPGLIIINGDFTVPGGKTFTINPTTTGNPPVTNSSNSYVVIWVKGGKFTTSGSGLITQVAGTNVTWIVDNDLTVSGDSYNNQNGTASTDTFIGVGTNNNKITDSGSATFTGTINAPAYSGTISGSGDYTGAIAASDLTISGSGSFHYDEALSGGGNSGIGNYAFASWFEDNSDPSRSARDTSDALHPIIY